MPRYEIDAQHLTERAHKRPGQERRPDPIGDATALLAGIAQEDRERTRAARYAIRSRTGDDRALLLEALDLTRADAERIWPGERVCPACQRIKRSNRFPADGTHCTACTTAATAATTEGTEAA